MNELQARLQDTHALGVDIGGSSIKWAVLDKGVVAEQGVLPTPTGGPHSVAKVVLNLVRDRPDFDVVGVAVPGVVDPYSGTIRLVPNLPGNWAGTPFAQWLQESVGLPVSVANDARCFGMGELHFGAGRGARNVVFVTLGTGVGGAVAIDGQIYFSTSGLAGELGHQTVNPEGALCGCGNRGCVETLAGAPAVMAGVAQGLLHGFPSRLQALWQETGRLPDAKEIVQAAREGDRLAQEVLGRAARALGTGLANVCVVLAPDRIVVGGGLGQALDVLREPLEAVLSERVKVWAPAPIVPAGLGIHGGAIGAAIKASLAEAVVRN